MIRQAQVGEFSSLAEIFFMAIREGPSPYSEAQRVAWAPHHPDPERWAERLSQAQVAVCLKKGQPVGFMTLDKEGYVDLTFILPDARRKGVFAGLLAQIELWARAAWTDCLHTHASLMAEPAFLAHGFQVIQRETVERGAVTLQRVEMAKVLA